MCLPRVGAIVLVVGRGDLTSDEWARLAPHLPKSVRRGGRWCDHRTVVNGILFRIRTGVPWRDLPERFGNWKTVYERHRRWSADGTWDRVLQAVQTDADAHGRIDWSMVSVDSTSCRAHQHAAGAPRRAPRIPKRRSLPRQHRSAEGLGRSRGGRPPQSPPAPSGRRWGGTGGPVARRGGGGHTRLRRRLGSLPVHAACLPHWNCCGPIRRTVPRSTSSCSSVGSSMFWAPQPPPFRQLPAVSSQSQPPATGLEPMAAQAAFFVG